MGLNQRESLFLKEGLTVSFFRFCVPARSLRTKKKMRERLCVSLLVSVHMKLMKFFLYNMITRMEICFFCII